MDPSAPLAGYTLAMKSPAVILTALGLIVLFSFMGWAFYATAGMGSWTGGSTAIAIMIAFGVLGTGVLTAVLMWLAFYSSRKGYDENVHFDFDDEGR